MSPMMMPLNNYGAVCVAIAAMIDPRLFGLLLV